MAELSTVATFTIWNVQHNTKVLRVIFASNWLPFIWHKQSIVDIGPSFLSEADKTGFFWRGFPSGRVIIGWPSAVANFSLGHQYRDSFAKHGTTMEQRVRLKCLWNGSCWDVSCWTGLRGGTNVWGFRSLTFKALVFPCMCGGSL